MQESINKNIKEKENKRRVIQLLIKTMLKQIKNKSNNSQTKPKLQQLKTNETDEQRKKRKHRMIVITT